MASCQAVTMMILLALAFIAATVSLALPYWVVSDHAAARLLGSPSASVNNATLISAGLWQSCSGDACQCLGNATALPLFLNVSRIVYSVSLANILVALVVSLTYLCCEACNCKLNLRPLQFSILVQVVACLEILGSVLTYGLLYRESDYLGISGEELELCWAFYLAAASGGFVLISLIVSVCETGNAKPRKHHYEQMKNNFA